MTNPFDIRGWRKDGRLEKVPCGVFIKLTPNKTGKAIRNMELDVKVIPFILLRAVPKSCKYATNKTAFPIVMGMVAKKAQKGSMIPITVIQTPPIKKGFLLYILVLSKKPIVDVNGVYGTKPKQVDKHEKIPVHRKERLYCLSLGFSWNKSAAA